MRANTFLEDLKRSKESEVVIGAFLEHTFNAGDFQQTTGNAPYDYSLTKNGVTRRFEQKNDALADASGSLFIECACRGNNSGLRTTTADWVVFYLTHSHRIYVIKTMHLQSHLATNRHSLRYTHSRDGNEGYLLPLEQAAKIAGTKLLQLPLN